MDTTKQNVFSWMCFACTVVGLIGLAHCDCDSINLTDDTYAYITSPGYPDFSYLPNLDLCWDVYSSNPDKPRVLIVEGTFWVEPDKNCDDDWVRLYDNKTLIGQYCGYYAFGRFVSSGDDIKMEFHSDDEYQYAGFSFRVQATDDNPTRRPGDGLTGWEITAIVLCSILGVCCVVALIVFFIQSQKKKKRNTAVTGATVAYSSSQVTVPAQQPTVLVNPTYPVAPPPYQPPSITQIDTYETIP